MEVKACIECRYEHGLSFLVARIHSMFDWYDREWDRIGPKLS